MDDVVLKHPILQKSPRQINYHPVDNPSHLLAKIRYESIHSEFAKNAQKTNILGLDRA